MRFLAVFFTICTAVLLRTCSPEYSSNLTGSKYNRTYGTYSGMTHPGARHNPAPIPAGARTISRPSASAQAPYRAYNMPQEPAPRPN